MVEHYKHVYRTEKSAVLPEIKPRLSCLAARHLAEFVNPTYYMKTNKKRQGLRDLLLPLHDLSLFLSFLIPSNKQTEVFPQDMAFHRQTAAILTDPFDLHKCFDS